MSVSRRVAYRQAHTERRIGRRKGAVGLVLAGFLVALLAVALGQQYGPEDSAPHPRARRLHPPQPVTVTTTLQEPPGASRAPASGSAPADAPTTSSGQERPSRSHGRPTPPAGPSDPSPPTTYGDGLVLVDLDLDQAGVCVELPPVTVTLDPCT